MDKNRPKIGIGVIVVKDNQVLMGKRKNSHGEGHWSFPGGHLEFNEEIEDCAIREAKEETNISIKNIKIASVTNDIFRDEKKHYITIHVMAEFSSGKLILMEPDKWEKWDWFNWNNWPRPLFLPIQNLIKQKGFKI